MSLWVPPRVSHELQDESIKRQTMALNDVARDSSPWLRAFNRRLGELEEGMELIFCPDPSPLQLVAIGAQPGRWGVLVPGRMGAPASVVPVQGSFGEYVDPQDHEDAIFNWLRSNDWQNPHVMRDRADRERREKEKRQKFDEAEKERADQEVLEMYLAKTRTQISMNRDTPWAQNAAGYRRTKGATRRGG